MAEVVPEMPPARVGAKPKYDWETWLNGQTWRLVQSLELPGEDGGTVWTEGDFKVGVEQMRQQIRNRCARNKPRLRPITRVSVEKVDGREVPVIFMKAVRVGSADDSAAVVPEEGTARVVPEQAVPAARPATPVVPDAETRTVDGMPIVRQDVLEGRIEEDAGVGEDPVAGGAAGFTDRPLERHEMEEAPFPGLADDPVADEWEQITPAEDPDDPYAQLSDEELAREVGQA